MDLQHADHVVFMGDSITNAHRMAGEVNDLYQLGAGYAMMAASRLRHDHPSLGLRFSNRGVSGNTVDDLGQRWRTDCLDLHPTVVSILIGINDSTRNKLSLLDDFHNRLMSLMERTKSALPGVRLLLCEPFGSTGNHSYVSLEAFDGLERRRQLVREIAEASEAEFLPLQELFDRAAETAKPDYWLYDGVHPTAAGHLLIADAWLKKCKVQKRASI